jgi:hypothetical protein
MFRAVLGYQELLWVVSDCFRSLWAVLDCFRPSQRVSKHFGAFGVFGVVSGHFGVV